MNENVTDRRPAREDLVSVAPVKCTFFPEGRVQSGSGFDIRVPGLNKSVQLAEKSFGRPLSHKFVVFRCGSPK